MVMLTCNLQGSVPSAIGSRHTAIRYLQSHDCIDKLKRNMREEHVLKLDWISTLFKHVSYSIHFCRDVIHHPMLHSLQLLVRAVSTCMHGV